MSANCSICGRPLTNPSSVARGVGPICGGRQYLSRIYGKWGISGAGWSSIGEWETVNYPCYTCKNFQVPSKEVRTKDGWEITANGQQSTIKGQYAIGGYCKALQAIVDGNQINTAVACKGLDYHRRSDKPILKDGSLVTPTGQILIPFN